MKNSKDKFKFYLRRVSAIITIAFFFSWLFLYAVQGRPTVGFFIALGIFAVTIITLVIMDFDKIVAFLKLRAFHKAFLSMLILVIIIALFIVLYFISSKFPMRFDVTKDKIYSISEQTIETLELVKNPLSVIVFRSESEDPSSPTWKADLLLEEYVKRNRNIKVEYVNPDQQPLLARKYEMSEYGETIFIYDNGKRAHVLTRDIVDVNYSGDSSQDKFVGEEKFTQAIYSLIEEKQFTIYFITGHGEKQVNEIGQYGLSYLKTYLESENYEVKSLSTVGLTSIPEDASLLIIVGPTDVYLAEEQAVYTDYISKGGKMIVLYDAVLDGNQSNLDRWLFDYGFALNRDFVVDVESSIMIPVNIVPQYSNHPIVSNLAENKTPSAFIVARSVNIANNKYNGSLTNILFTSRQSYGKIEPTFDISRARFNPDVDIPGPVGLAVLGIYKNTASANDGMIAVFGDAHFVQNGYISVRSQSDLALVGNKDLILNTVAFMLGVDKKITIRPKEYDNKALVLTTTQNNIIVFLVQLGLPLIFAIVGLFVWYSRRR